MKYVPADLIPVLQKHLVDAGPAGVDAEGSVTLGQPLDSGAVPVSVSLTITATMLPADAAALEVDVAGAQL